MVWILGIGAVDISSTTVAGQVSDTTGKTGRTFVFIPLDSTTTTTSVISSITITIPTVIIPSMSSASFWRGGAAGTAASGALRGNTASSALFP